MPDAAPLPARGSSIADPIPDEDEHGGDDERDTKAAVEDDDGEREDEDKGEEEGRADPVDGALRDGVVLAGFGGDGRKGEPLFDQYARLLETEAEEDSRPRRP